MQRALIWVNLYGLEAVRRKLKNNIYRIARMGQNFDDYPGFQQIPGMPILLQQSVDVFWLKESNESLGNSQTDCSNKTN